MWFGRESGCTLRGNRESRIGVDSVVHRDARYGGIVNRVSGLIIRATSCTLRGNRELRIAVESFVHQDARYEGIGESCIGVDYSCNKLHATGHRIRHYH